MSIVKKHIINCRRKMWLWWQRVHLKNGHFTLITNNCIGGIIYHDLGIQFQSPTINLDIPPENFLTFLEHFEEYLYIPIVPLETKENCPVGVIHGDFGDVQINFRHYKTFEEGVLKWNERKKRIHWDNLFVIMEDQKGNLDVALQFERLPFKNKALFSLVKSPSSVCMPVSFYGNTYHWGKILEYPQNSIHRFLERLDYVKFINRKGIFLRKLDLFDYDAE